MKEIAYLADIHIEKLSETKQRKERIKRWRIKREKPTVTLIKVSLVLIMGVGALIRLVYELVVNF